MPSQNTDLPRIFRRAAEVIEHNGLHQGAFVAPAGVPDCHGVYHLDEPELRPVDVVGAIRIACGQEPTCSGGMAAECAIRYASEHMDGQAPLEDGVPDHVECLALWSDLYVKKATEVVARLWRWAIEAENGIGAAA